MVKSIRAKDYLVKWTETYVDNFSSYINSLIEKDIFSSGVQGELYTKIFEVIDEIDERVDEIMEDIVLGGNQKEAKDEIDELIDFKVDLHDAISDILSGDLTDDDARELLNDINEAQQEPSD